MSKFISSLIIGSLLLVIGVTITILDFYKYEFINTAPDNTFVTSQFVFNEQFDDKEFKIVRYNAILNITEDDSIEEGNLVVKVSYYKDFVLLNKVFEEGEAYKKLRFTYTYPDTNFYPLRGTLNTAVESYKTKKIFNYSLLFRPIIDVHVNSRDVNNVKIINY